MLSQRIVLLVFQLGYRVASLLLILQYSTLYFAISNLYLCMHHRVRITKIVPATLQCGLRNTFCLFIFLYIKSISMFALRAHQAGHSKVLSANLEHESPYQHQQGLISSCWSILYLYFWAYLSIYYHLKYLYSFRKPPAKMAYEHQQGLWAPTAANLKSFLKCNAKLHFGRKFRSCWPREIETQIPIFWLDMRVVICQCNQIVSSQITTTQSLEKEIIFLRQSTMKMWKCCGDHMS